MAHKRPNMTTKIDLFCPKCSKLVTAQISEGERTDHKVTCAACGATSEVGHLKTAEGKTLLEHAEDTAKEAFKAAK